MHSVGGKESPVLLLGGQENALSIVRSLSRHGVRVSVAAQDSCWALRSRYCFNKYICPQHENIYSFWESLLLGEDKRLHGSIVFACNDEAMVFLADYRAKIENDYILDDFIPEIQLKTLDKMETLRLAKECEVGAPYYWNIDTFDDVVRVKDEIVYPVMIKPIHSHLFKKKLGFKLFIINEYDDLIKKAKTVFESNLHFMLCEVIPGPDSLLTSYYTYIDRNGERLFDFTKGVIRRFPYNRGSACYHYTKWMPETAALGKKFFNGIQFRGLGNIEFKKDPRDEKLKIIEVNARFTAAQELLYRSGMDISHTIYKYLTGKPAVMQSRYRENLRYWYPRSDYYAFKEMNKKGMLSWTEWMVSIFHLHVFPYFSRRDPWPAIARGWHTLKATLTRSFRFK